MALQQSASLHVSSTSTQVARARQNLCPSVEEAISQQIRNELSASYAYLAMVSFYIIRKIWASICFIGKSLWPCGSGDARRIFVLRKTIRWGARACDEANWLCELARRKGQAVFFNGLWNCLVFAMSQFQNPKFQEPQQQEWDSLHAALLDALALEKMNNQNLLNLHKLASEHSDPDVKLCSNH